MRRPIPNRKMVNKGKQKAPPAAPAAKAPASTASKGKAQRPKPAPEDDFIVFTTGDKDPKKRSGGAASNAGPSASDAQQAEGELGPPKPTVKQIIGGASWTGKLPVNLLSEHCQKQKWDRPDYHTVSCPHVDIL